jgi:hypothetical protein
MVRFLPFHGYMCCSLVGSGAVHLRKISGVPCHKVPGSSIRIEIISQGVLLLPNVPFLPQSLPLEDEEILWLPTLPVKRIVENCLLINKMAGGYDSPLWCFYACQCRFGHSDEAVTLAPTPGLDAIDVDLLRRYLPVNYLLFLPFSSSPMYFITLFPTWKQLEFD